MQFPPLPDGYVRAPVSGADAADVVAIATASQAVDLGAAEMTVEELLSDWHGVDLENHVLLIRTTDGEPAAFADTMARRNLVHSVYADVAPAHRCRGLGTAIVAWGEEVARRELPAAPAGYAVIVQHYIPTTNGSALGLLRSLGYVPERQINTMQRSIATRPAAAPVADGIAIRQFDPERDLVPTFKAVEEAFRDSWGRPPGTLERFRGFVEAPGWDPRLWLIATEGDEVIGAALGRALPGEVWIDTVGVRAPWRQRGVALALITRLFGIGTDLGLEVASLSVDSESSTGAPRLYTRAGMTPKHAYVVHRKRLREGLDPATYLVADDETD